MDSSSMVIPAENLITEEELACAPIADEIIVESQSPKESSTHDSEAIAIKFPNRKKVPHNVPVKHKFTTYPGIFAFCKKHPTQGIPVNQVEKRLLNSIRKHKSRNAIKLEIVNHCVYRSKIAGKIIPS